MSFIVKFKANCGDEFDVYGFRVMTQAELDDYFCDMLTIYKAQRDIEVQFGSNESLYFSDYEDYKSAFEVESVNKLALPTILRTFGREWGFFPEMEE